MYIYIIVIYIYYSYIYIYTYRYMYVCVFSIGCTSIVSHQPEHPSDHPNATRRRRLEWN